MSVRSRSDQLVVPACFFAIPHLPGENRKLNYAERYRLLLIKKTRPPSCFKILLIKLWETWGGLNPQLIFL